MVFQLQLWSRNRLETLNSQLKKRVMKHIFLSAVSGILLSFPVAYGDGAQYLRDAAQLYQNGDYFKAARYAFSAAEEDSSLKPDAYAWITLGLIRSGLPNSASYF